jgi:hypothetical protein
MATCVLPRMWIFWFEALIKAGSSRIWSPSLLIDDISVPVVKVEHLIALKVFAMKNDPERSFREIADLQYLLGLPGLDMEEVRGYFERYGQMEKYDELAPKKKQEKPQS